ncbi:DUF3999 domain-containing protein [Aggregicoccus sp. 17bor-14]|uniref:DUF3999 family protein n=1 Tax=Myxococcaceae TaxID=31 RepID=UPI00129C9267|nr:MULTISPECIES: DUF3999 family protein [Myxococcaceae]MBF5044684.1 DUF3999 domain-containing protein [Simulacricoccus sp. 17bor-14]MRI90428.1 DUF3999 domain-containing protein [Aggregicoccus sp. 17bor-14]
MTRLSAVLLLLAAALAQASEPEDFARQWPVSAQEEGAYAVELTPEVYAQARQPDLSDVAAFDAKGEALAFGPMPAAYVPPRGTWRPARWFPLPAPRPGSGSGSGSDDLRVLVRRSAQGELTLDSSVRRGRGEEADGRDLLIDVQGGEQQVDALALDFAPDAPAFSAEARVEASDDLRSWRTVASGVPVALLRQGDQTLLRRHVELSPGPATYLRVRVSGEGAAPAVRGVQLRLRAPGAVPRPQWLEARFVQKDERGGYVYALPARVPAEQLDVQLGADNAVAHLSVQSREGEDAPWRPQAAMTAFRLRGAGLELVNEPAVLAPTRERQWRLQSTTPLARPPVLRLAYVPERWLLLTHGPAPFRVVAGSERARRDDYPLDALVAQVRAKYGPEWEPVRATLGASEAAGGEEALRPVPKGGARTYVLWGVLVLGALAVVAMVLQLLKAPPPARG